MYFRGIQLPQIPPRESPKVAALVFVHGCLCRRDRARRSRLYFDKAQRLALPRHQVQVAGHNVRAPTPRDHHETQPPQVEVRRQFAAFAGRQVGSQPVAFSKPHQQCFQLVELPVLQRGGDGGHIAIVLPDSSPRQQHRSTCMQEGPAAPRKISDRSHRRIYPCMKEKSILKGAIAGMIGGLAGAGAKMIAEEIFPPRTQGQPAPPVVLAEQVAGHALPSTQKQAAMQGIHWTFGALAGAVYGVATEVEPSLAAWRGAAFGVTLNRMTHETLLPRMGLSEPRESQPTQERISEWVTHAVYGIVTDSVRRLVRKAL